MNVGETRRVHAPCCPANPSQGKTWKQEGSLNQGASRSLSYPAFWIYAQGNLIYFLFLLLLWWLILYINLAGPQGPDIWSSIILDVSMRLLGMKLHLSIYLSIYLSSIRMGVWTQGLVPDRQALYHLRHIPSPWGYTKIGEVSKADCLSQCGWAQSVKDLSRMEFWSRWPLYLN
jgi:hypothetical protein